MTINFDDIRNKLKGKQVRFSGSEIRWYKLPEDESPVAVRFLPPVEPETVPGKLVYKHWGFGSEKGNPCFKTWEMECDYCRVLSNRSHQLDVTEWESQCSSYFNVLLPEIPGQDPHLVHLLQTGDYTYYWLLDQIMDIHVGDITDPIHGSEVIFKRKKKKGPFERTVSRAGRPIAATADVVKQILDSCYKFNGIWKKPDDEAIQKMRSEAAKLDSDINTRIMMLRTQNASGQALIQGGTNPQQPGLASPAVSSQQIPQQQTGLPLPASTQIPLSSTTQLAGINKPPKAPDCFGTTKLDPTSKVCLICPYQFNCEQIPADKRVAI